MVPLASWVTCMVGLPLTQVGPSGLAGVSPPVGPLSDLDFRPIARLITLATSLAQKTLKPPFAQRSAGRHSQDARRAGQSPAKPNNPGNQGNGGSGLMTQSASTASPAPTPQAETRPDRASIVLLSLILVAAVANLNLSVGNVALPDIGIAFDASRARPGGGRLLARARGICVVARRSG